MVDYNPALEPSGTRTGNQPGGVSEDPRNEGWSHRTEMEPVDSDKRRSVSERVNENREGELVRLKREQQEWQKSDGPNSGDDSQVDSGKSKQEQYADKYGDKVSDEMKRKLAKKRIEELNEEADEILNNV